ncbi:MULTISPECIES: hypothetical protein [unclassified Nocardia]|uniref:hypothetical protein n=1 Tax=unclassified Nocardia TaxID=2637762 RepID=UPI0033AFF1CD
MTSNEAEARRRRTVTVRATEPSPRRRCDHGPGHGSPEPGASLLAAARILHELALPPADARAVQQRLSALPRPRAGRCEHCDHPRLRGLVDYAIEHMELAAEVARAHEVIAVAPELAEILWIVSACACRLATDLAVPAPPLVSADVPALARGAEDATARMLTRWRRTTGVDTAQRELGLELETVLRSLDRIAATLARR